MKIETPPFDYAMFEAQLAIFMPCQHRGAEPRRKMKSTGRPFYKIQCPACGRSLSGQLKFDLVTEFEATWGSIKPWDEAKEKAWVNRRLSVGEMLRGHQDFQRRASWWSQYEQYLQGPEWREIRRKVMARANGTCERCKGRRPKHVHHLTYARVGQEELLDLLAVCIECHQELHPDRSLDAAL